MRNGHGIAGDDPEFLFNLLGNLNDQERKAFYSTVSNANICYSAGMLKAKTPEQQARDIFKAEKNNAKGKLKKLYAAMQKAKDLKGALEVHYRYEEKRC